MTVEQFDYLSQFEEQFTTAIESDWARNISKAKRRKIYAIYKDITGDKSSKQINCGKCWIELLKEIGNMYFEFEEPVVELETLEQDDSTGKEQCDNPDSKLDE